MSSAKITLSSFYTWFNTAKPEDDLFKNMQLPAGIDKDTLVADILMRGGEFEVMYSDPYFMQNLIGPWSKKWYRTFEKWVKALAIDYNPLENYDRMEEWDETKNTTGSEKTKGSLDRNTTDKGTQETTVSAYDSNDYEPSNKISTDNSGTLKDSSTGSTDSKFDDVTKHNSRVHGNVGVTTSQQMLESELDLAQWNLYEHISDIFLSEFVIPIYS